MYYSFGIFVYTIFVGACMLTSGKFANKKKRLHEFLTDKLAEKKALRLEDELRKKQDEEYAAKVGKVQAAEQEADPVSYDINDDNKA